MTAGRVRLLASLAAVLGLLAFGTWFRAPSAGPWSSARGEAAPERADAVRTQPLAMQRFEEFDAPRLVGRAGGTGNAGQDGHELVTVQVAVVADDGGEGEVLVEAGGRDGELRPCGLASIGETKDMTVRASARFWRASALGQAAALYEAAEARRPSAHGHVTLRLARGAVSLTVRVTDEDGEARPGVCVRIVSSPSLDSRVLTRETDGSGIASWNGLVRAVAAFPRVSVCAVAAQGGVDADVTVPVLWDADGFHGAATVVVKRSGAVPGRLVGPGLGLIRRLEFSGVTEEGAGTRPIQIRIPVTKRGEFAVPRPRGLVALRVRAGERRFVAEADGTSRELFVVPGAQALDPTDPLEVRTVLGRSASGLVRDAGGVPVAGALVRARARPRNRATWDVAHAEWFDEAVSGLSVTDAEGRFRTREGLPGAWTFVVLRPGATTWIELPDAFNVPPSGPEDVVLTLPD
jgi:hypothetical protein